MSLGENDEAESGSIPGSFFLTFLTVLLCLLHQISQSPRWDNGWANGLERAVFLNNSGFSYHSVFTPSSKQYMLWSELDIGLGYIFATVTHLDIMCMILNTQDGLVNLGLF